MDGYGRALSVVDRVRAQSLAGQREGDFVVSTADQGWGPATPSTDHSREDAPWLIAGPCVRVGVNLGTLPTFADISATILDAFDLPVLSGTSHAAQLFL